MQTLAAWECLDHLAIVSSPELSKVPSIWIFQLHIELYLVGLFLPNGSYLHHSASSMLAIQALQSQ
jgi:hypothetical protein